MPTDQKSIDYYNHHAEEYAAHTRNPDDSVYHSLYEKPAMRRLLPNLVGKRVLSLGCGPGEDSGYLKSVGASESVGIDVAEQLIVIAQQNHPACEFRVMDMEKLEFPDETFDFVYSSSALHYLEDWTQAFREAYRVLQPGGQFLFSCGHPVYSAMDIVEDSDVRRVRALSVVKNKPDEGMKITGDYLKRRIIIEPSSKMNVTTWSKPIGEIAAEATNVGFIITAIIEPKPEEKMKRIKPRSFAVLSKIPYFLIVKLEKR